VFGDSMKYTWDIIYIVVGITAIYIAIIIPSLASYSGIAGIGILLFGLYKMYTDHKNTTNDSESYDYNINDSPMEDSAENDFNNDDSTEDEFYKYKYHVTKYQFRIIVGIVVMVVLVLSVLIPQAISNISTPDEYHVTTYNNTTNTYSGYGISFNFPSNWTLQTDNGDGATALVYTGDSNNETPFFQITVTPNANMRSDQQALDTINTAPDYPWDWVSNNTLTIDNNTVYENTYTAKDPTVYSQIMKMEQVNMFKNRITYSIVIQAPSNKFNKLQPEFNTMLNSFKISLKTK
jgi:hypothetical protein